MKNSDYLKIKMNPTIMDLKIVLYITSFSGLLNVCIITMIVGCYYKQSS